MNDEAPKYPAPAPGPAVTAMPADTGIANIESLVNSLKTSRSPFEGTPLLRFIKGVWRTGKEGEEVQLGTTLVALVPDTMIGHTCWKKRKPIDYVVGRVFDGFRPDRNRLGDLDKKFWEQDTKGEPLDPWQLGLFIQFADPETEKVRYVFAGTSKGAIDAITCLLDAYARRYRENPNEHFLPVIELAKDGYQHPDYGWVHKPLFEVVNWTPAPRPIAGAANSVAGADNAYSNIKIEPPRTAAKVAPRDDLDDEIPF